MLDRNEQNLPWRGGSTGAVAPRYDTPAWEGYGGRFTEESEEAFDPVKLFWLALRYRWLIAVLVGLGLVLGLAMTLMQSPKYAATARIEIMVPTARVLEDMDIVAQSSDLRTFETAREKLRSRDLARRVALELNLANDARFLFPRPDFSVGNIFARIFGTSSEPSLDAYTAEEREQLAISQILRDLSANLIRGTSLLEVRFASHDPERARQIANQVVQSYMDQQVDRTIATSDLARQFIDEQVAEAKNSLEASEAALVAYSKDQQLGAAGEDGSLITASITAINDALAQAIQRRLENERLVAQIDAGDAAGLTRVLESQAIQNLRGDIATLRSEYQQKLGIFKPAFPEMQRLSAQISELERQLQQGVNAIAGAIRLSYEASLQEERDLRQKLAELEVEQVAFRDKNIQYTILNREVASSRAQYQSLIDKRNELGVVSDLRRDNIDVVDYAITPTAPFQPSLFRNLLLFLGGAVALSAAAIYILELLNNKFSTPDQVESELKLPVLGIIPKAEGDKLSEGLLDPRSALSEAYRSLRTSLQFSGADGAPRTLLVTSAEPGESKSTSAYKLAEEFAALGEKVLIVDCDLRRPSLHRVFKTDNTMGLTNLLTNTVAPEDVQQLFHHSPAHPKLDFLSTGPMVPNPADLLSSSRMGGVIRACTKAYSLVILDGPPVIGLSDALILSRHSEATLLVVAAHQTARKSAGAALKRLHSAGGNIVGAMLGKLDIEKIDYSYAYRYMYEGYYSYGSEETPRIEEQNDVKPARAFGGWSGGVVHLYRRHLRPLLHRA
ncbi:polysaccharide biosynthesis tyrosine autokinase [Arsenicitalea aurantiaca]|uniref:non-specific protein-tyrosine kinase n=1 Tax=Arsenicitalea aurantiaca TaxID=1783274 RepID=A0A433X7F7_9HYPH|nr:polysaccharide biosynthesis tyrosine autokinase [Arsenicitalea aurantiaca]RUT29980.1 polysaccharide biosynthesis tyrosine autokinase [Arsenicitalea aurantiaca]